VQGRTADTRAFIPPAQSAAITRTGSVPQRTGACPCGSGKRYKHCCGALLRMPAEPLTAVPGRRAQYALIERAVVLMHAGEAAQAESVLAHLLRGDIADAGVALVGGEMLFDLHLLQPARTLLQRARELAPHEPRATQAFKDCCDLLARSARWRSAAVTLAAQLERINAGARRHGTAATQIHIVCKLDTFGGTERRALNLYRCLRAHARVTLWSVTPVLPEYMAQVPIRVIDERGAPAHGTLVLVGTYFDCGGWLQTNAFERVVICHNLSEQYRSLAERFGQIESNPSRPAVALTFPSKLFRDVCGLPGRVEYPATDVEHFRRDGARRDGEHLRIGRHGRAYPLKFHPNDPALFRAIMARGHEVRILGGSIIAGAFADERTPQPQLLDVGAIDARSFLQGLDVFVYRKHPRFFETCGTAILEAMSMELPVIIFAEDCGGAELIEHGENGFLVDSEADALACIDRLQADPELRVRLGHAARATIVELAQRQAADLPDYYVGGRHEVRDHE